MMDERGGSANRREIEELDRRTPMFTVNFDVDAEAMWLGLSKVSRPSLVSQGVYGINEGLPRILDLLADCGVHATFFVPGMVAELHPSIVPELLAAGHEVASHGYSHAPLSTLASRDAEQDELSRARDILEAQGGQPVVGFGAAACDVSAHTIGILLEQGMLYDRSFLDADWPYRFSKGETSLIELPISWVMDDFTFFGHNIFPKLGWGIEEPAKVGRIWQGEFETVRAGGGLACLVMHPEVMGRRTRLPVLRDILVEFSKEHVFRTCAEIARQVAIMPQP